MLAVCPNDKTVHIYESRTWKELYVLDEVGAHICWLNPSLLSLALSLTPPLPSSPPPRSTTYW